jgi:amino acid transporter
MKSNITKYAIIVYIIVIIFLYLFRPNIIYNKETKKFREFGFDSDQSILSLPILAIILAILIYIIFSLLSTNKTDDINIPKEYTELINKMTGGGLSNKAKLKFMAQLPLIVNYSELYNNNIE